jgi:excisionase family DNA binding protein
MLENENLPAVLTVKDVAQFLRISEQTVKRALKAGLLRGFKAGRDWRIYKTELLRWANLK